MSDFQNNGNLTHIITNYSTPRMNLCKRLLVLLLEFLLFQICISTDTINFNDSIKDGDVLVSSGGTFTLGFFSPVNSSYRYVGIWYTEVSVQTVVWIANRDSPINGTSGVFSINTQGNLVLFDNNSSRTIWSTNVSVSSTSNSAAQLLDSGNFVLVQQDSKTAVWQSIDYPTNTMLPFTKLGVDRRTGLNRFLRSWKSLNDPGTGVWSYYLEPEGLPELVLYNGKVRQWRSGPWDGIKWNGIPQMSTNFLFNTSIMYNKNETTVSWGALNSSIISILFLDEQGQIKRATWHDQDRRWIVFWNVPEEICDFYGHCGANGNCNPYNAGVFECTCLPGFEPKLPNDWYLRDGSGGCVRKQGASTCRNNEGFVKVEYAKVPDTSSVLVDMSLSLQACQEQCFRNCSCNAYATADLSKGFGCVTWYGDLLDTRVFTNGGQDIYIRVDSATFAQYKKSKKFLAKRGALAALVTPLAAVFVACISIAYCCLIKRGRNGSRDQPDSLIDDTTSLTNFEGHPKEEFGETRNPKLPIFNVNTIISATDNFSFANKLGQGGFGSVYKGRLPQGQEIAVKRLSKNSRQGIGEFKNEVKLISKLQHKNLVRLFGCCIYKEEKMLIYEYLPNKSLDFFIFDITRRACLDWSKRLEIIIGIGRGLLYLHQDSRLKIIHRDLKASNVLLDAAMNPKISDFGMARIFGEEQTQANTNRVVGTYGYMSPEYAMEGIYSIKSDVFSYGVLTLEIIGGRKNIDYYDESPSANLIGRAWELWQEGKALDIVDSTLGRTFPTHEVLKCIQVGLLCVQECPADRPTMSAVIFMLGNETVLPSPNKPAFITNRKQSDSGSSTSRGGAASNNDVTITKIDGR